MIPTKKEACALLSPWMKKHEGCHYKEGWLYAGNVGVDSGTISINDPAAISCTQENYEKQLDVSFGKKGFGNVGNAFVSHAFMGDDVYPVYVKLERGSEPGSKPVAMQVLVDYSMGSKYFGFLERK